MLLWVAAGAAWQDGPVGYSGKCRNLSLPGELFFFFFLVWAPWPPQRRELYLTLVKRIEFY